MSQNDEKEDIYLFLDFNGKLEQDFFKNPDVFFKIVNLQKKNPMVQLENFTFRGLFPFFTPITVNLNI